jgi:hypothetical protein
MFMVIVLLESEIYPPMFSHAIRTDESLRNQLEGVLRRLPTAKAATPIPTRITPAGSGTVAPEPGPENDVTYDTTPRVSVLVPVAPPPVLPKCERQKV